jgi:hypothetical protein
VSKDADDLAAIKDIVRESILDEFVRELLGDLRNQDDPDNEPWAESTIDWLFMMYGDPGPVEESEPKPAMPEGVEGFSINGRQ